MPSLFADSDGQVHIAYHHEDGSVGTVPRYRSLDGTAWSYRKTLETAPVDDIRGFDIKVVAFGVKKTAAYFRRKNATIPRAELRLATWESSNDTPQVAILEQDIPAPDAAWPAYRVALAVDKYGLLHVAALLPHEDGTGILEYFRQTRNAAGEAKWLSDIVDEEVLDPAAEAHVDMIVDENARPHIAYRRSAKDGLVRYATRFDR